jgi:hypothetical protein
VWKRHAAYYVPRDFDACRASLRVLDLAWATIGARPVRSRPIAQAVTTLDGMHLRLSSGGGRLKINGAVVLGYERHEFPGIYRHFDMLLRNGTSDVDVQSLQLVADFFQGWASESNCGAERMT